MLAQPHSLALLLCVGVITGCAVGPDYRSPEIALPSTFIGQADVEHRSVQHKADLSAWWAAFDDPLLTHFVSLALEQNLDIAQAAARVVQSRDAKAQAQIEVSRAAIASFRALGGGWDARNANSEGLYSNLSTTNDR